MRSLLELSARTDTAVELADWVEMSAFFRADRTTSKEDLVRALIREGSNRSEQTYRDKATEAFNELDARDQAIGNSAADVPVACYPFEVDGDVLKLTQDPFDAKRTGLMYTFFLAITRASMDSQSRQLKSLDPTTLFEEVCAESLCQFWGGRSPVADVFITGTSNQDTVDQGQGRYRAIIDALTGHLQEGGGWKKGAKSPGAGDGGLDVAVWRRFQDKRPGGLVGFAQCKTGDRWREHLGKNNPNSICHSYFTSPLVLAPTAIYMVPCRVSLDEWSNVMRKHIGILFDRCRITTFCTNVNAQLINDCSTWTQAAIESETAELLKKKLINTPSTTGTAK